MAIYIAPTLILSTSAGRRRRWLSLDSALALLCLHRPRQSVYLQELRRALSSLVLQGREPSISNIPDRPKKTIVIGAIEKPPKGSKPVPIETPYSVEESCDRNDDASSFIPVNSMSDRDSFLSEHVLATLSPTARARSYSACSSSDDSAVDSRKPSFEVDRESSLKHSTIKELLNQKESSETSPVCSKSFESLSISMAKPE